MGHIKDILRRELKNTIQKKKFYEEEIKSLPVGCLSLKNFDGREYYYLAVRKGKKVKFTYKGKLSPTLIRKYDKVRKTRTKYKLVLKHIKKEIIFLNKALKIKGDI